MTTPSGVYPLATPSGEAIPLDVINPIAAGFNVVDASGATSLVLPPETSTAVLYSTVDAFARLNSTFSPITAGVMYDDAIFLPAGVAVSVLLSAGTLYLRSVADAGNVYVQLTEKWNSLGVGYQYGTR